MKTMTLGKIENEMSSELYTETLGEIEPRSYNKLDDILKESKKITVTEEEVNEWLATCSEQELGSKWYAELHPESVIRKNHNKELADECKFKTKSKTCEYKNYWEKCAFCKKEVSR